MAAPASSASRARCAGDCVTRTSARGKSMPPMAVANSASRAGGKSAAPTGVGPLLAPHWAVMQKVSVHWLISPPRRRALCEALSPALMPYQKDDQPAGYTPPGSVR